MLLAVDIGNTQTSFGIFDQTNLRHHWRFETKVSRTSDEFGSLLFPLLQRHGIDVKDFSGIVFCSVVPAAEYALEGFCEDYCHLIPFKIDHRINLGFKLNVDFPGQVGADRLANVAYAVECLKLPAIIVDSGTGITLDVVSKTPAFEGGVILPGVRIAVDALSSRTSKLPSVELEFPPSVIGKNTVQCIQAGILYGYCDMIEGLLERTILEIGETPEIAVTGGLAFLFQQRLKRPARLLPNLTLDGIRLLYERNTSR